ncbi:CG11384 [Drosophila busckii]|uniref:Glycosyltransferase family 92 protein n=2 Tax=Drosophila busckii TaxID=30019 RepID=A0A0M5J5X9_DROBS|nr:CG11384 [Drosophila busckii]
MSKATPPPLRLIEEPLDEQLVQQLEQELPEVDYEFWYKYAKPHSYRYNRSCAPYADPLELQLHNIYWQSFQNENVSYRLYAAYWDERITPPKVRVLVTANQMGQSFPPSHCQLWYADRAKPLLLPVVEHLSIWIKGWGYKPQLNYPHLLACELPAGEPPRTVSLVAAACARASNSLRVHYAPRAAPTNASVAASLSFGVCVKGFDFPYVDLSEPLIEWFELQRLLGAARIYAYMYDVHPSVQRVLDYYQRQGFLELRPLTMASGMPRLRHYQHMLLQKRRLVKRLNELIPYNDCFYRNMYRHDYMLNVDIDEIVLPLGKLRSWQQLVQAQLLPFAQTKPKCGGPTALCAINGYFTKLLAPSAAPDAEPELQVLQRTLRYRNYSLPGRATKCFHNTRFSLTLHNHFTLKYLPTACRPQSFSTLLAHMQHYREPDANYTRAELVEDRAIWRYAPQLRAAVEQVWLHLDDAQQPELDDVPSEFPLQLQEDNESELELKQLVQQLQLN